MENDILAGRAGVTSTYDMLGRLTQQNFPDGGQVTKTYTDVPPVKVTTTSKITSAMNLSAEEELDGLGRIRFSRLLSDPQGVVYTDTTYDPLGRVETVSNPYRSTGDPTYGVTTTEYDALGRVIKVIPPDGTVGANHITTTYSGNSTTVTDQAGKQRRSFTDALGRLIQVDEPGLGGGGPATAGTGSATVGGSIQSVGGTGPTPGTGSATVGGTLQTIPGGGGTAGTGSVSITGFTRFIYDPDCTGPRAGCPKIYDSGGVQITVNGFAATAYYGQGSTSSGLATILANVFNTNPSSPVTATASSNVVYLTSKVTGVASNYSLSAATWSDEPGTYPNSYTATPSGSTLTGGTDGAPTVYDSGSVWVTVNGVTKSVGYGQGSSSASIASALASAINADGTYPVSASVGGTTINLTAKASGAATNYSLAGGSSTSQPGTFSQPSFSISVSGSTLSGGADGTPPTYDSGSVWVTVNGQQKSVSYGQGSTDTMVATALRDAINADGGYPVSASLSGSTLTLTAKNTGASTNYSLAGGSFTNQPGTFSQPSFSISISGPTLTGGADATPPTNSLATPSVTKYTYDTLGNLTCVEQQGNVSGTGCDSDPSYDATSPWRVRRFTYNSLAQLLTATNPESGTICYGQWSGPECVNGYDADGNLIIKTAPRPNQTNPAVTVTTTHTYDELHRLKKKEYSDGTTPLVRYAYDGLAYEGCNTVLSTVDAVGLRTAMCDGAGNESWAYFVMGRVATDRRTTNGVTKDFTYTYNLDGSLATMVYPTSPAHTITYSYNAAARALSAVDVAGGVNYATAASYTPGGALASLTNGASIVSTYFYNSRLQPCRISVRASGSAPTGCDDLTQTGNVLDFRYGFNLGVANNGNVTSIENRRDLGRSQSFTYDELNRIATAQTQATSGQHCWGETFSYDVWANLLNIGQITPTYNGCTQESGLSVAATTKNQISGHTYDAAGNLTTAPGMGSYTYDAENRIIATAGVSYAYDGDGRRVQKSNGKLYWYGGSELEALLETDLAGNTPTEYIFFGGKRAARRDSSGSVFYYFANHLGSANVVTSSAGTIVDESDYYPFGGERVVVNTDPNPYKFTGKERDTESDLDYFVARYYSNKLGRFMTPDWAAAPTAVPYADFGDPQSLNLYTYVGNNPITRFDADGHCWPISECAKAFQNAVSAATDKLFNAAAGSGNVVLAAAIGTAGDLVNGAADAFRAGEAVGACLDSCNGTQMADAVSQDLNRTAGLVAMAAGGGEAVVEKVTQRALTKAATEALDAVGPGKGAVHGTKVHTQFGDKVEAASRRLGTTKEVSYKNGDVVPRGTPGSVRVDAVRGNPARPQGVYDLKTGGAKLTPARRAQIQKHLPRRTKIKEIRPAR